MFGYPLNPDVETLNPREMVFRGRAMTKQLDSGRVTGGSCGVMDGPYRKREHNTFSSFM